MIILSLGSNLSSKFGNRKDNLKLAISLLESGGIIIVKKSSVYETPSYPDKTKPKFLNILISVETDFLPEELMRVLLHVEKKLERKRKVKNEPRTCDIDIIDYHGQLINIKKEKFHLIIPHKNLSSRIFVLIPLQEILPNWKHPKTKEMVTTLIQKLPNEERKSILKIKKD